MISPYNVTKNVTATLGIPEYTDVEEVLDTDIKELLPTPTADDSETTTPITPGDVDTNTFFQIYETIKGDIPNSGDTESHTYLLNSSLTQLGDDILSDVTSTETNSDIEVITNFTEDDFTINKVKTFKHDRDVNGARADYWENERLTTITELTTTIGTSNGEIAVLSASLGAIKDNVDTAIQSAVAVAVTSSNMTQISNSAASFSIMVNDVLTGNAFSTAWSIGYNSGSLVATDDAVATATGNITSYYEGQLEDLNEQIDRLKAVPPEFDGTFVNQSWKSINGSNTFYWWPLDHSWHENMFEVDDADFDFDIDLDWSDESVGPSDKRLKENIVKVGTSPSGINIYEFNFKSDTNKIKYRGVIGDELLGTEFESVVSRDKNNYIRVDYSKIDVDYKRV